MMNHPAITWLLEPSDPSVRYRALRELLDRPAHDPEVSAARRSIDSSLPVTQLLAKMHPHGYWLQANSRTGRMIGEGVEYGEFGTTHYVLAYLSELGMDCSHPQVALAAERYLNLQQPDGDWQRHFSCLYGYNIRTFLMLGYRGDPRVQRSIRLLEQSARFDGGYLCDMHEPPPGRKRPKSCIRGSLKALAAFSELDSEYWEHPGCKELVDYFLSRGGIYQRSNPSQPVNRDVVATVFPFHWRAGLVEVLYHLSRMGHGSDPRLETAWALLESKTDGDRRYWLDWTPVQSPWKIGRRGQPNKWITLYALLAKKYAGRN